nr:hypothetical protein [Tanacetum cinerariifolium]
MQIIEQSGSAPIVFFNTMVKKLSSYTAWELMERHGMDVDEYWPEELLDLDDDEGFTTPINQGGYPDSQLVLPDVIHDYKYGLKGMAPWKFTTVVGVPSMWKAVKDILLAHFFV